MALWLAIAALTGLGVLCVLLPLGRRGNDPSAPCAELDVYRDQLDEIERDRARGLIDVREAESARTEVARRVLASRRAQNEAGSNSSLRRRRAAAALALIGVPVFSLAAYSMLGSPGLPGQPLAARLSAPPEEQDFAALLARVESHLREAPEDGRGWDLLAPIYLRLGRADDAARAYENSIRLLGETEARRSGLGEALVAQANGIVTENARSEFERAAALAPDAPKPAFFLALAKAQEGKLAEASADWAALLAGAPSDAPWRSAVEERIISVAAEIAGGKSLRREEIAAAGALAPEARKDLVNGMVTGLAARLRGGEKDLEGWLRLARAYAVLGDSAKASAAIAEARSLFVGDPDALARIEAVSRGLGIGS